MRVVQQVARAPLRVGRVAEVLGQIARYTADNGFFASFVAEAAPGDGHLPASLARDLTDNANAARVAYDRLAAFLSNELAPVAGEKDAVGRELYGLHSRRFLGATIDLDETYEWGLEELARMVAEGKLRVHTGVVRSSTDASNTTIHAAQLAPDPAVLASPRLGAQVRATCRRRARCRARRPPRAPARCLRRRRRS